jgi:hypothetical protein
VFGDLYKCLGWRLLVQPASDRGCALLRCLLASVHVNVVSPVSVYFALPTQDGLRDRLTRFPDRIHMRASGASPSHDRLDITAHADEENWELREP